MRQFQKDCRIFFIPLIFQYNRASRLYRPQDFRINRRLYYPYSTWKNYFEEKINYLNKQMTKLTQESAKQAENYEKHINQLVKEVRNIK